MDSDVVLNCGSENVIKHNLLELSFFICLSRFGEKIRNIIRRCEISERRVFVFIGDTAYKFLQISYFCWSEYDNMEFKWSLDENMCALFAIMSALNAKQQAMVTVSYKFFELNRFGYFADMDNM